MSQTEPQTFATNSEENSPFRLFVLSHRFSDTMSLKADTHLLTNSNTVFMYYTHSNCIAYGYAYEYENVSVNVYSKWLNTCRVLHAVKCSQFLILVRQN